MGVKMSGAKEFDARLAAIGPKGCWAARRANRPEGRFWGRRSRAVGAAKPRRRGGEAAPALRAVCPEHAESEERRWNCRN